MQWNPVRHKVRVVLLGAGFPASALWGAAAVLALVLSSVRPVWAATLWIAINAGWCLRAAGSFVWQGRLMASVWPTVLRWGLTVALLLVLVVRATVEPWVARITDRMFPSDLMLLLTVGMVLPFATAASVLASLAGAGLGMCEKSEPSEQVRASGSGVRWFWAAVAALLLVAGLAQSIFPMGGLGLASLLACAPIVRRHLARHAPEIEDIDHWMKEMFVWQRTFLGRLRRFDLRSTVLAMGGFAVAIGADVTGLLGPLQASALTGIIRLENAVARMGVSLRPVVAAGAATVDRVVLVDWDSTALRLAHTTSSEVALLARVVRSLSGWDVSRVVMTSPALEPQDLPESKVLPDVGADDAQRSRRDSLQLERAIRESGRVIWVEGEADAAGGPAVGTGDVAEIRTRLAMAALARASGRLESYRLASLPCVPTEVAPKASEERPLPWIMAAEFKPKLHQPRDTVDGNRVLVDFGRAVPGHDFLRVSMTEILEGVPVFRGTGTGEDGWRRPEEFYAGKVVIVSPMVATMRATPLGEMSRSDVWAYAMRSWVDGGGLARVSWGWRWGTAWVLAMTVGLALRGNGILIGVMRWGIAAVAAGLAGGAAGLWGIWMDPVLPTVSAGLSFLMVTQWSTTLDRRARDRNQRLLQRFVAPEVVREMLERREGRLEPGGQRERVAVLFADVRGFTQFAEANAPEEVMRVVNAYLAVMTDALNRHGGLIDKYTGDGLMALFRLRSPHDLEQAVDAALEMRDAALQMSQDRLRGGDTSLRVGISLHAGDAVVGLVGSPSGQINFTALGLTVVVAARLQAVAGAGELVVSGDVAQEIGKAFELSERPALQAKGISRALDVRLVISRKRSDTGTALIDASKPSADAR